MILMENLEKYQPYHQEKLINMIILLAKKYYHLIKNREQNQLYLFILLGKAFEKQTKTIEYQGQKQIKAIEDNKKQLPNTNANDYKNEFLFQKKEKYWEYL